MQFDTIIKNGFIIDGTGRGAFRSDVGIFMGKIAAVAILGEAPAKRVIDAGGLLVTPGFIDMHRHADAAIFKKDFGAAELKQGLTSIVNGNCGLSAAPFYSEHDDAIKSYLRPVTGSLEGVPHGSMREYLSALKKRKPPINAYMLVGAGVLRADAAGYTSSPVSAVARKKIYAMTEQALQDGAIGVSLGLGYAPECFYTPDELTLALAPLKGSGVPVTAHMREEGDNVTDSVKEMISLSRALKTPVRISHLKAMGGRNWHSKIPEALALISAAREEGLDISCDVYPYTAGSTQLMHILPTDMLSGGIDALSRRLTSSQTKAELRERIACGTGFDNIAGMVGFENIFLSTLTRSENKRFEGMSIKEAAAAAGEDEVDFACDLLASESCAVTMIDYITCDEDILSILRAPFSSVISDATYPDSGLPHPRVRGNFARIIEKYVVNDKALTLEQAVHKMTKAPADALRLAGKGVIAPRADADILIFKPEEIRANATFKEPFREAQGMKYVLVGGETAI